MGHLYWMDGPVRRVWSHGSAEVLLDESGPTGRMPLSVHCRFGSGSELELALLDTGAAWTVLAAPLANLLEAQLGEPLETLHLSTRLGTFTGTLHRLPICLVAEQGENLDVEGTCLVMPDWPGPSVLGIGGCIDRIRMALEPGDMEAPARIHFGAG